MIRNLIWVAYLLVSLPVFIIFALSGITLALFANILKYIWRYLDDA